MKQKRIVITGAPGTGKTAVVKNLEAKGFFCFHEIIRKMTAAAKNQNQELPMVSNPLLFVDDPLGFNRNLIALRVKDFNEAAEQPEKAVLFYDRGIPDVLAYMHYFKQDYPSSFLESSKMHRYDEVFIMPPWREIYRADNERLETYEEACSLDDHLTTFYRSLGYATVVVPKISVEERVAFIINHLNSG